MVFREFILTIPAGVNASLYQEGFTADMASILGIGTNAIDGISLADYCVLATVRTAISAAPDEVWCLESKLVGIIPFPAFEVRARRNNTTLSDLVLTIQVIIFPINPERLRY